MTDSTSSSNDAFNDSLNFIKKLWGGMGVPGMQGMGMSIPTLSLEELDKRIQELKSVEAWLNVNISMLHNSIQALEIQRATIATLHTFSAGMAQSMQSEAADSGSDTQKNASAEKSVGDSAAAPDVSPFISQSTAWWGGVQEQFKRALEEALAKNAVNYEAAKSAAGKMAAAAENLTAQSTATRPAAKNPKPAKSTKKNATKNQPTPQTSTAPVPKKDDEIS